MTYSRQTLVFKFHHDRYIMSMDSKHLELLGLVVARSTSQSLQVSSAYVMVNFNGRRGKNSTSFAYKAESPHEGASCLQYHITNETQPHKKRKITVGTDSIQTQKITYAFNLIDSDLEMSMPRAAIR
jgi:hypothetical protein